VKRVSYLSLEFLIGRSMQNALLNMDLEENYRVALKELGLVITGACIGQIARYSCFFCPNAFQI
jgi:glucan phosphorylase